LKDDQMTATQDWTPTLAQESSETTTLLVANAALRSRIAELTARSESARAKGRPRIVIIGKVT
jgi:hypothetical protein